ncbi:hypothetical protein NUW54_g11187 [Trametes sanguinea]|uniref:Uncharacterized protein n=1 Tax=Trametes sanguinea TaxID=158606 RepID=A0ACC1NIL6_9APHY|nr:hypothetical protein NUW54_g11187 [Trametes sanguinea]
MCVAEAEYAIGRSVKPEIEAGRDEDELEASDVAVRFAFAGEEALPIFRWCFQNNASSRIQNKLADARYRSGRGLRKEGVGVQEVLS